MLFACGLYAKPGADQRISCRSYRASTSRSARTAIHFESGDQPTVHVSVKVLDKKPLGKSEKSAPATALGRLPMPRTSPAQPYKPFFPSGDQRTSNPPQSVPAASFVVVRPVAV